MKPFRHVSAAMPSTHAVQLHYIPFILVPLYTDFEWKSSPVVFIENGKELVKLPGEYYCTSNLASS